MRALRGKILPLACVLCATPPAAEAQLWQGPAAVEVRVEDNRGKAAAGAQVKLEYLDLEPPAGPPPVTTDGKGRAVVGSLAEGRWRLSVSREGFMTYQTELAVRRDGKPEVLSTLQLNVPNAVHTMDVKVARSRSAPAPAAPPAPDIAQAPPPAPSRPAPAPRPEPTPSAPAPKAEPPAPIPSPTPAQPAPPRPSETPSSAPRPAPSAPPQPAPPPSVQPAPPAAAPAIPTPPPGPTLRRRSYQDRTCFECKPGESSLSVEQVVPPAAGAAGCGTNLRALLAGSAGGGEPAPGCRLLRISLPRGARYTGYRYEIQDGAEPQDCMAGRDCPAGAARWPLDPVLQRSQEGTTVVSAFENRSPDRERRAILTVYYTHGGADRGRNR